MKFEDKKAINTSEKRIGKLLLLLVFDIYWTEVCALKCPLRKLRDWKWSLTSGPPRQCIELSNEVKPIVIMEIQINSGHQLCLSLHNIITVLIYWWRYTFFLYFLFDFKRRNYWIYSLLYSFQIPGMRQEFQALDSINLHERSMFCRKVKTVEGNIYLINRP